MRDHLVALLEQVDMALSESVGVIPNEDLDPLARVGNHIRVRLAYPESVVVAGVVGGTGSGKSSLLNAIVGAEVAPAGGIRPTTSEPLAHVPELLEGAMEGLLDHLGIERRVVGKGPDWLCLIDTPDTDSLIDSHRELVMGLIPGLDVVIWVVDPVKYRDAAVHRDIRMTGDLGRPMLFVLNQVDRVGQPAAEALAGDLSKALEEDGLISPQVFTVAADPPSGPPIGLEELTSSLKELASDGERAHQAMLDELKSALRALPTPMALDFEPRWAEVKKTVGRAAVSGRTAEASHVLTGWVSRLAAEAGGPVGAEIAALNAAVVSLLDGFTAGSEVVALADLEERLDAEVAGPIRSALLKRARSQAALTELSLALEAPH